MNADALWGGVYLLLGLWLGLGALVSWWPRLFGPFRALAGIWAMILTLVIPQLLFVGGVLALVFWRLGAFETQAGRIGLGLHLFSWLLLGLWQLRLQRTRPRLDGVEVPDDALPFGEEPSAWAALWAPTFWLRTRALASVEVEKGHVFREAGGRRLKVDIYKPPQGAQGRPAIVYVHGGGWVSGTRRQSRFMCAELATMGHPVYAISYRLAPRVRPEQILEDCKAALAWVRARQERDGAGPQTFVVGGSAGGHLASMLALTANQPEFQPGFESADTSVHGAVIFYGVSDLTSHFEERSDLLFGFLLQRLVFRRLYHRAPDSYQALEPLRRVSAQAPPLLFVHGTADTMVPLRHSLLMVERLKEAGAPHVHLLELPHAHHAFEVLPTVGHQRVVRVVGAWLRSQGREQRGEDEKRPAASPEEKRRAHP